MEGALVWWVSHPSPCGLDSLSYLWPKKTPGDLAAERHRHAPDDQAGGKKRGVQPVEDHLQVHTVLLHGGRAVPTKGKDGSQASIDHFQPTPSSEGP